MGLVGNRGTTENYKGHATKHPLYRKWAYLMRSDKEDVECDFAKFVEGYKEEFFIAESDIFGKFICHTQSGFAKYMGEELNIPKVSQGAISNILNGKGEKYKSFRFYWTDEKGEKGKVVKYEQV